MTFQPASFERDVSLGELLRAVSQSKLASALTRTIGDAWRIAEPDGRSVCQSGDMSQTDVVALPLQVDIEIIGHLHVEDRYVERAKAAVKWLEMVLVSAYRYRMAADLHRETVTADFEALQKKHAALQESEARYRELATQLEQRVKAQVEVIERTQRQLYETEKLASVGSLAAGMAHEINNPIGFIRSNLGTASGYVSKIGETLQTFRKGDAQSAEVFWQRFDIDFMLEDFPGLLEESLSGADRVARIVANLKAYASIDRNAVGAIDLNDAVQATARMIEDQLPEHVRLELSLQPLMPIACDLSRMNQVLFALFQNARDALGSHGGLLHVASGLENNEIRITVRDDGCGIPDEILDRIFDPFFTTRGVGKGMGLGLTVSRDIVQAYGGRIEVETAVGAGSTFTVCLPCDMNENPGQDERSL